MGFVEDTLAAPRPDELASVDLPRRLHYHTSPDSWQDEVVYFLLVDRFSDGAESTRPQLDRTRLADATGHAVLAAEGASWEEQGKLAI